MVQCGFFLVPGARRRCERRSEGLNTVFPLPSRGPYGPRLSRFRRSDVCELPSGSALGKIPSCHGAPSRYRTPGRVKSSYNPITNWSTIEDAACLRVHSKAAFKSIVWDFTPLLFRRLPSVSLFPLVLLHEEQSKARFSIVSEPPSHCGTIWSSSSSFGSLMATSHPQQLCPNLRMRMSLNFCSSLVINNSPFGGRCVGAKLWQ